jgi:hypothetical protein
MAQWWMGEDGELELTKNFINSVVRMTGAEWSVLLTQYCAGGKIETNEMGRACGAYGGG